MPALLLAPVLKLQVGTEARARGHFLTQRALIESNEAMPYFGLPSAEGPRHPKG